MEPQIDQDGVEYAYDVMELRAVKAEQERDDAQTAAACEGDIADTFKLERDEAREFSRMRKRRLEKAETALWECMEQLITLANETYWTLYALPITEGGMLPRDLDAGGIAKDIIDGKRVELARALLLNSQLKGGD